MESFFPTAEGWERFQRTLQTIGRGGSGTPSGNDGFPAGPWTPELLAEAISEIDSNRIGVDLRTVQLWFQENEKGISPGNIRWLARIFGCDDPIAISEWQMELSAAQSRLTAKRREGRKETWAAVPGGLDEASTETLISEAAVSTAMAQGAATVRPKRSLSLAVRTEGFFSSGSPLNLPAAVFAGVTALGFLAYVTGVHCVNIERTDRVTKQVGFLWAPNWTLLFMVFLLAQTMGPSRRLTDTVASLMRAVVREDVRSIDGARILTPKGSRVVGEYKSRLARGRKRIFIVWSRVIRSDGASVEIAAPGADRRREIVRRPAGHHQRSLQVKLEYPADYLLHLGRFDHRLMLSVRIRNGSIFSPVWSTSRCLLGSLSMPRQP